MLLLLHCICLQAILELYGLAHAGATSLVVAMVSNNYPQNRLIKPNWHRQLPIAPSVLRSKNFNTKETALPLASSWPVCVGIKRTSPRWACRMLSVTPDRPAPLPLVHEQWSAVSQQSGLIASLRVTVINFDDP